MKYEKGRIYILKLLLGFSTVVVKADGTIEEIETDDTSQITDVLALVGVPYIECFFWSTKHFHKEAVTTWMNEEPTTNLEFGFFE